jgi:hypothetical protein
MRDIHLHPIAFIRIGGRSLGIFEESKAPPETGSINKEPSKVQPQVHLCCITAHAHVLTQFLGSLK